MINTLHQFFLRASAKATVSTMLMDTTFYWWLAVAFFFLIMEMGHPGLFYFLSFFFAGLVGAVTSCVTDSIVTQQLSFFISMIIALCFLRPWVLWLSGKNRPAQQTNFYALKGKKAIVKQDIIGENAGLVTINGQIWVARVLHHHESLFIGDMVEIIDVRGAHVVVKKI